MNVLNTRCLHVIGRDNQCSCCVCNFVGTWKTRGNLYSYFTIYAEFDFFQKIRGLKGRTLFITGASRGIGKAIALKAARDGANVVIAAKTAEPHPKLKGTIYTAAKESK